MAECKLTVKTAPTVEPITVADLKLHCRIDNDDEDDLLESLIKTARTYVEQRTKRTLLQTTYELYLDWFPAEIVLPLPPVSSLTSITYYDTGGSSQTLSSSVYTLDSKQDPAVIVEAYGQSWPATRDIPNAITVTYVAGYGAAATSVPDALKRAVAMYAAHLYENREPVGDAGTVIPLAIDSLIRMYEVPTVV